MSASLSAISPALAELADLAAGIDPRLALLALIAVNLATFAAFGLDKARARRGDWRIQESTLLGMALLGGSIGAWSGRRVFRHKTRKQPFNSALVMITLFQVGLIVLALAWWRGALPI